MITYTGNRAQLNMVVRDNVYRLHELREKLFVKGGENMRVIVRQGDYRIEQNQSGEYAVFKAVKSPSCSVQFWQQISRWYVYYRYAEKCMRNRLESGENNAQKRTKESCDVC